MIDVKAIISESQIMSGQPVKAGIAYGIRVFDVEG